MVLCSSTKQYLELLFIFPKNTGKMLKTNDMNSGEIDTSSTRQHMFKDIRKPEARCMEACTCI